LPEKLLRKNQEAFDPTGGFYYTESVWSFQKNFHALLRHLQASTYEKQVET
jgi:hypothetical protein